MSTNVANKLAGKSVRKPASKQVRLRLVYVSFWSSVKLSFLGGLAFAIIGIVVTFLIWTILTKVGLFTDIDNILDGLTNAGNSSKSTLAVQTFSLSTVMGFAIIIGILDIVIITALGAIVAALYNLAVKITGGLLVGFTNN